MDFHQTCYVHWYCGHRVWDCWWANFVIFDSYLSATRSYVHFRTITWVNLNGFSTDLVYALILWRAVLELLMGNFDKVWKSYLPAIHPSRPRWLSWMRRPTDWRPGGRGFNPRRDRQHSFVEIDHKIFSTVILSLPLIHAGQLSVLAKECAQYWLTA